MGDAQGTLPLYEAGPDDPAVQWLEQQLRECQCWKTAAELLTLVGKEGSADGPRWIRMLAEATRWIVSGQRGYKHLEYCTPEEISHFVNWMESQGKKMIRRAERVRRNAHAVLR
jgi:hypothetical protein